MSNQVKVGIFTAITIIIFVIGFYFLKGVDLFERRNIYYAVYKRVDGLNKSNPIEINGFPIGRVGNMARDAKNELYVVELIMNKDVKIPDSDSTLAQLVSVDLLGSKKVEMIFGQSNEYLKEGDTIGTEFKKELSEQISPIMSDVGKIVPTLDTAVRGIRILFDVNNPQSVFGTLKGVNDALGKINTILASNQESIQGSLKNIEGITKNLESNNAAITSILKNAQSVTDSLQAANLKAMVDNLNATAVQLNTVVSQISAGQGTLGKAIKDDGLYNHIDTAVNNLNVLLKDIKARPYRYINVSVLGAKKHEQRMEKYDESGK